jgi:putative tryptophan/tyrosine transport system substrate-binding protein
MRRREFIARLGAAGVYAAMPSVTLAQQGTRVKRLAVLVEGEEHQIGTATDTTFRNELARLGWVEGRNLHIDMRYGGSDPDRARRIAAELTGLGPDVIFAVGTTVTAIVQQQTQTIPIVFVATDGLAVGLVKNLGHPEGNTTGVNFSFQSMAGKWVQLLKDAVPRLQHVGYFYNPRFVLEDYFPEIEEASRLLGMRAERIPVGNGADIARSLDAFAAEPDGGLVDDDLGGGAATISDLVIQHRLPAVCRDRSLQGCLIVQQPHWDELTIRTASFVDRILRGAKPSDLPVEYLTRYELVVNLKTAKALGLTIPPNLLAIADEVIE